jgi:uncharacterized protein (UPF0276 family)
MTSHIKKNTRPFLGFGLGLRHEHYDEILQQQPKIDWLEIITENYLVPGGKPLYYLDAIRKNYPIVMHGVSLSIGSTEPLNFDYLKQVKLLAQQIEPEWISDHLCWTGTKGFNMHDLLPLPYTHATIDHVVAQINAVQDFLGRKILIENVSSYLTYHESMMPEWEFLAEIVKRSGCHLLLDINNIFVSSFNHDFNPLDYIRGIAREYVYQIHLAGHMNHGDYIIDTHDAPVIQAVWDLYAEALQYFGPVSTMIERDANIPPLAELLAEIARARAIAKDVFAEVSVD